MIKAVFIDYTGTIIQEKGEDIEKVIARIWKNSKMETPQQVIEFWWSRLKELEEKVYQEYFRTEDEIVDCLLDMLCQEANLQDNLEELHQLCQRFWMYAPIFEDVKEFFEKCSLPIYVITNNGVAYVQECLRFHGLRAKAIVSGEMVRAYKPHRELFDKALEVSGCRAEEVIHIGDSIVSDVKGALGAEITPVLIDRKGTSTCTQCRVIHRLAEALDF